MKTVRFLAMGFGLAGFAVASARSADASKVTSDLVPPQKRQDTVDKAIRLTRPAAGAPVSGDLNNPFNPTGFDQVDVEEQKANAAAGVRPGAGTPAQPAGPMSDRELLESLAPRIQPTGMTTFRDQPLLTFPGAKRVRVGDVIAVTDKDRDYDIEIVAIDRTNFTLRYRREEITRPIAKTTK